MKTKVKYHMRRTRKKIVPVRQHNRLVRRRSYSMGLVSGSDIPVQITVGRRKHEKIEADKIKADPSRSLPGKPGGYLWTSSYTPDQKHDSEWLDWVASEQPEWYGKRGTLLYPSKEAKIFEIKTEEDIKELARKYGKPSRTYHIDKHMDFDWEKMSKDIDAVRLDTPMLYKYRLNKLTVEDPKGNKGKVDFYPWDVESTVWFKAPFEKQEEIDIKKRPEKERMLETIKYAKRDMEKHYDYIKAPEKLEGFEKDIYEKIYKNMPKEDLQEVLNRSIKRLQGVRQKYKELYHENES